ncbi:hypothetical protein M1116_04230 [Patescibacteria group bacterium]|nr:hypothetical protein [Patescibacteria group bacterium]
MPRSAEQFLYTLAPYQSGTKISVNGVRQTIVGVFESQIGFTRVKQVLTHCLHLDSVTFGDRGYSVSFTPRWEVHDPIDTLVVVED